MAALLGPGEIGKVEIAVEPEKAGTLQNRADVFVEGVRESLGHGHGRTTRVKAAVAEATDGGGGNRRTGLTGAQGDQCSPVTDWSDW